MLLKDELLQEKLFNDGYVVIPFLSKDKIAELNSFYNKVHNGIDPPDFIENIHMTTWCTNAEYKQQVAQGLMNIFEEPTKHFFQEYRRLNNVFIVKKSGQQTTFKVHQDWNVIDETKFQSANIWVPLHDVDEHTGALWVLKGSHKINRPIRGAGYLFPDYGNFYKELEENAFSVKLKAGEAVVFYHSVIHGSPPNLGNKNRVAACFSVIPKQAPLCIYFQRKATDPLEQHQPNDNFMYEYTHLRTEAALNQPSKDSYKVLDSYTNKEVTKEEIMSFVNQTKNYFQRLFK